METRIWLIIREKLIWVIERQTQSWKMVMIRWADECFGHLTPRPVQTSFVDGSTYSSLSPPLEGKGNTDKIILKVIILTYSNHPTNWKILTKPWCPTHHLLKRKRISDWVESCWCWQRRWSERRGINKERFPETPSGVQQEICHQASAGDQHQFETKNFFTFTILSLEYWTSWKSLKRLTRQFDQLGRHAIDLPGQKITIELKDLSYKWWQSEENAKFWHFLALALRGNFWPICRFRKRRPSQKNWEPVLFISDESQ